MNRRPDALVIGAGIVGLACAEALGRAGLSVQVIDPANTFILGDTPRDIECANANGCIPISVATGHFSTEELREAGGEIVFDSFEDYSPLLDRLGIAEP